MSIMGTPEGSELAGLEDPSISQGGGTSQASSSSALESDFPVVHKDGLLQELSTEQHEGLHSSLKLLAQFSRQPQLENLQAMASSSASRWALGQHPADRKGGRRGRQRGKPREAPAAAEVEQLLFEWRIIGALQDIGWGRWWELAKQQVRMLCAWQTCEAGTTELRIYHTALHHLL